MPPHKFEKFAKEMGINGRADTRLLISNWSSLHGEQFDFNVFCLGTEVEHGTVAIHRGTGVYNFYAVYIHDTTLLVDMGAADKIEVLDVAADALAAHMFTVREVERLKRRCMGNEDIMNRLFHLCRCIVEQIVDLLVGQRNGVLNGVGLEPPTPTSVIFPRFI